MQPVCTVLVADLDRLEAEVATLARIFYEGRVIGHAGEYPHAYYGYLMACMAKIDLWSSLWAGRTGKGNGSLPSGVPFRSQTRRMVAFMTTYLGPDKETHRIAVELFRHTLLHTGAMRFLYDEARDTKYTWRVFFGEFELYAVPHRHYTISDETSNCPGELATITSAAASERSPVHAINVSIPSFVADLRRALTGYLSSWT